MLFGLCSLSQRETVGGLWGTGGMTLKAPVQNYKVPPGDKQKKNTRLNAMEPADVLGSCFEERGREEYTHPAICTVEPVTSSSG